MAVLLDCVVCKQKVSSDASVCPHCGSSNFKPAWYISQEAKTLQEEWNRDLQKTLADADIKWGHSLEVEIQGEYPYGCSRSFRFYGSKITGHYSTVDDNNHIRLLPGTYTARYFETVVSGRTSNEIRSEAGFTVTETSQKIILHMSKRFLSKHYKLVSVTVK